MSTVNLLVPLKTPNANGFRNADGTLPRQLFGYSLKMLVKEPCSYLELLAIPSESAADILQKVRAYLSWAAVRLNFGIVSESDQLQTASSSQFGAQFPTIYPSNIVAQPIRMFSSHRTQEADALLFSALIEADSIPVFSAQKSSNPLRVACELFAAADFEATANSKFIALTSILEILATPKLRPKICIDLIDAIIASADATETADDSERVALDDLRKSACHWKTESFRSSIRKLATRVSATLGDADPPSAGRRAVKLYDARSTLVHNGTSVSWGEVTEIRQIVREALAVEVECYEHIRERFPTN